MCLVIYMMIDGCEQWNLLAAWIEPRTSLILLQCLTHTTRLHLREHIGFDFVSVVPCPFDLLFLYLKESVMVIHWCDEICHTRDLFFHHKEWAGVLRELQQRNKAVCWASKIHLCYLFYVWRWRHVIKGCFSLKFTYQTYMLCFSLYFTLV